MTNRKVKYGIAAPFPIQFRNLWRRLHSGNEIENRVIDWSALSRGLERGSGGLRSRGAANELGIVFTGGPKGYARFPIRSRP
jgi:hypothetical protein